MSGRFANRFVWSLALLACFAAVTVVDASPVDAFANSDVVINEIVAANDSFGDNYGETPDWIELQNNGNTLVSLAGWSIADNGGGWVFPAISIGAGQRLILFASGRNESNPELHTDFSLQRDGETVTLADNSGTLIDEVTYGPLDDDQAFGRGPAGGLGYLVFATPGASNSVLAPSSVTITTPGSTFQTPLQVSMTATTAPGEVVRYTTDASPVSSSSSQYTGPFTISTSTVVRAAVVGNGAIGPESSEGYTAVSSSIAGFSSDIPIVLVHSTGAVGTTNQDAIVTIIDRDASGRASILGEPNYSGFAGLRIRGASSQSFPKKQFKFELWGDRLGEEVDAQVLDLGFDSDWVLYAPGNIDRAMINNPLMYELGKQIGVVAPDYQFVELYIEDDATATIGDGDYLGLYVLRENIKIDDDRVDITEHSSSSAGPDGGYIVRYDWNDSCCSNIEQHPFGSYIAVDSPGASDITTAQFNYISNWWNTLQASASNFQQADSMIDFDSLIDHWLLSMLAYDVDVLRASHYMHKDANGELQGGPLWDFDRSMGANDSRIDGLEDAIGWDPVGSSGHTYASDIYADLWDLPEVQARLRARWSELRQAELSDSAMSSLITTMGAEIQEAYLREDVRWGPDPKYGSRFGDLNGELNHMIEWLGVRSDWLDDQFLTSSSPPVVIVPAGGVVFSENTVVSYQVDASDPQVMFFSATGLPDGLSIDASTGLISGTVAYGDAYQVFDVELTVSDSSGASTTVLLPFSNASGQPGSSPLVLNEYNSIAPGKFLRDGGEDSVLGRISGNGGDWFELVTTVDELDLRGWRFDVWFNNDAGDVVQSAALKLDQSDRFANVRAGSIITVAESMPEDLSYDPVNNDWTMNLQSTNTQAGSSWANQTDFDTNHKKWRLVIRDDADQIRGIVGGETAAWTDPLDQNLKSDEVLVLDLTPSTSATGADYAATENSTYGEPNILSDGSVQDFVSLRPELTMMGDVTCEGIVNVLDAVAVAQYVSLLRTDSDGCPLSNPSTEMNLAAADVDSSGVVNVLDAVIIAQCSANLNNVLCPQ